MGLRARLRRAATRYGSVPAVMTMWAGIASVLGFTLYLIGVAARLGWLGWIGVVLVLSVAVPRLYFVVKRARSQQSRWERDRASQLGLAPDDPAVYEHAMVDPIDWRALRARRRDARVRRGRRGAGGG